MTTNPNSSRDIPQPRPATKPAPETAPVNGAGTTTSAAFGAERPKNPDAAEPKQAGDGGYHPVANATGLPGHLVNNSRTRILGIHPCDERAQVITVVSSGRKSHVYRREPCVECPWRIDSPIGAFPVEAYRHSAATCYDMAQTTFACHMSGSENPATCAGFLLSIGAEHNLMVRLALMDGRLDFRSIKSSIPLYATYQEMAIANGVQTNDPALKGCRS